MDERRCRHDMITRVSYPGTNIIYYIYVNDLPQCSNKFDFIMYADDTTLSSTIDSFSDINSNTNADVLINIELGKVIDWLKINKLSLNKNKSKYA